ncbi:hypothetical protein BDZ90DRAFT_258020 [Jaminaea rosea]|uniref:Uncharacterized protein n=1 Tax=Jaminaea rosea TaxID=1569628 RepID=A0A316V147_9BASI|nr:hypothetical protein BDZ90DRAFT_258020 [Jaminaea rosea]PWN30974.1 hypothetical protein BDZ90DRAFT_258020 [Jaminaea rosea]
MPRLSPVPEPSTRRLPLPEVVPSAISPRRPRRKRALYGLPYEDEDDERQAANPPSQWLGSHGADFQPWPRAADQSSYATSSSSHAASQPRRKRLESDALYDVVAWISARVLKERRQEKGGRRHRSAPLRPNQEDVDNDSVSAAGSMSSALGARSSTSASLRGSGQDSDDETESDGDAEGSTLDSDLEDAGSSDSGTTTPHEQSDALLSPLVLSIQSSLETLLTSLEQRRRSQVRAQSHRGWKQPPLEPMTGSEVLSALERLVTDEESRRGGREGKERAESCVGGREVLEAVRRMVKERAGESEEGVHQDDDEGVEEVAESELPSQEPGERFGDPSDDVSMQHPNQQPQDAIPSVKRRRPPPSKNQAKAATWTHYASKQEQDRQLERLLLLS